MSTRLLLEAALRSLIMGATIYGALRLFRIRQVHAQRTAWLLALVAALAMPLLVALRVGPRLLPQLTSLQPAAQGTPAASPIVAATDIDTLSAPMVALGVHHPGVHLSSTQTAGSNNVAPAQTKKISYATLLYLVVAGFLLLRLVIGLVMAQRIRARATPVFAPFDPTLDVRTSPQITTPVTIASSILLPASSATWNESTLAIVLTHERAHLRQRDFYLQLLAAAHSAIFWFSPLSWWLQRELSALGEAMSDLAAVEQAESRASYAEVLLAFATRTAYPRTSVAMARASNLKPRIERLLNDRLFNQSAAGKQRLTVAAAFVVILAIAGATSMRRVHAAQATPVTTTGTGSSTGSGPSSSHAIPQIVADQTPGTSIMPDNAPDNAPKLAPVQAEDAAPQAPAAPEPPTPPTLSVGDGQSVSITSSKTASGSAWKSRTGYSYLSSDNGDVLALVHDGDILTFSGDWKQMQSFEATRRQIHGDYVFYRHDGKSFVVQDAAILARAQTMYAPMHALESQQAALAEKQAALGARQETFARQIEAVKIPTPDLNKELAELDKTMQRLKQLQSKPTVDMEELSDLQGQIGEIQGHLGELQGQAGEQQGKFGEQQGELGEEQGKLGEQQGKLGEEQGKIWEELQRQIKPMIEQAIRDGKAKPID